MKGDALTFDELAHLGAGYSYLVKHDYRLNPEHPPLSKDIIALPLLFLKLNFPDQHPSWAQKETAPPWWAQFDFGRELLYRSGNNPRQIIIFSRSAMIMFLILLGWLLFFWSKKIAGNLVGLGVLIFFAFSPTFLAHGRLTNTDIGAAAGALIATMAWLRFLKKPGWLNIFWAGLAFGLAMIFKFSLILLIPFFAIITLIYAILFSPEKKQIPKIIILYLGKSLLIGLIGVIFVIWPVYQFHIQNYPIEHQIRDTINDISGHPVPWARDIALWLTKHESLRALGQYARGLLMASQRTAWGNTAVFMGEIAANSWLVYFPTLYFLKEPLAFHLLSFIALIAALIVLGQLIKKHGWLNWLKNNFIILACLLWVVVYWTGALLGNLNIGIRHLMPTFPFIYILVAFGLKQLFLLINSIRAKKIALLIVLLLFYWYIGASLSTFPYYLSYYNELAGGIKNGYKIAVDSNYDWGQDFYRLLQFIEKNKIEKIYIDYFGGEDLDYWLKDRYLLLQPKEIKKPPQGWLAVSVNQLQGGLAKPVRGFDQPTGYYKWLENYEPKARAGYSIFIYYLD
ncbi:MAG: ArnT family glycosyltransferase [Minisyncoccia bacterium]